MQIFRDKGGKMIFSRTILCVIVILGLCAGEAVCAENESGEETTLKKSPTAALFWGAAIPGGGDFYTGKTLKGVVFFSLGAYLGLKAYGYWKKSGEYYDDYAITGSDSDYSKYSDNFEKAQTFFYYYMINLAIGILDGVSEAYLSDWKVDDVTIEQQTLESGAMALYLKKEF